MEEKKVVKKNRYGLKIIYWIITIVGVAFIVASSVRIGEKLAKDSCNCNSNCSSEELTNASKDKYEFNYHDGGAPGNTYEGSIDLKTGEANITVTGHCTSYECVNSGNTTTSSKNYEGKFDVNTLNKIISYLEKNDYPDNSEKVFKIVEEQNTFMTSLITILENQDILTPSQEKLDSLLK